MFGVCTQPGRLHALTIEVIADLFAVDVASAAPAVRGVVVLAPVEDFVGVRIVSTREGLAVFA